MEDCHENQKAYPVSAGSDCLQWSTMLFSIMIIPTSRKRITDSGSAYMREMLTSRCFCWSPNWWLPPPCCGLRMSLIWPIFISTSPRLISMNMSLLFLSSVLFLKKFPMKLRSGGLCWKIRFPLPWPMILRPCILPSPTFRLWIGSIPRPQPGFRFVWNQL